MWLIMWGPLLVKKELEGDSLVTVGLVNNFPHTSIQVCTTKYGLQPMIDK